MRKVSAITGLLFFAAAVILLLGCRRPPQYTPRVKLATIMVVDQGAYDTFMRFRPLFTGGFKRLFDTGRSYSNAYHDHSETKTCPGHATLITGRPPRENGIIDNDWFDRGSGSLVYCVSDWWYGSSPRKLIGPTLPDRLKDLDSQTKVFAISGKDRGAIMLGGHSADGAYWFDVSTGKMTSSSYYPRSTPQWLQKLNEGNFVDSFFGALWKPLPVSPQDASRAGIIHLEDGVFPDTLPHAFGVMTTYPNKDFYAGFLTSPFGDELTLQAARALIVDEHLGVRPHLDFLGISLSSVDIVGHHFGHHSPEVLDTFLRLDKWLGEFFSFVDEQVGKDNWVVLMSADHGVAPYPELMNQKNHGARRVDSLDTACLQQVNAQAQLTFGIRTPFISDLYLNQNEFKRRGISLVNAENSIASWIAQCGGVKKVWTAHELSSVAPPQGNMGKLFFASYNLERSPNFMIERAHNYLDIPGRGTTHGTPHDYDRHVPLIIMGSRINAEVRDGQIATTDAISILEQEIR